MYVNKDGQLVLHDHFWKVKQPISWSAKPVFFGLFQSYKVLKYRYNHGVYEEAWMPSSYAEIESNASYD